MRPFQTNTIEITSPYAQEYSCVLRWIKEEIESNTQHWFISFQHAQINKASTAFQPESKKLHVQIRTSVEVCHSDDKYSPPQPSYHPPSDALPSPPLLRKHKPKRSPKTELETIKPSKDSKLLTYMDVSPRIEPLPRHSIPNRTQNSTSQHSNNARTIMILKANK